MRLPLMTPKERSIYKDMLLGLSSRQPLDIFEYGTGYSTLYFAQFLMSQGIRFHIHSVDHNRDWHLNIKRLLHQEGFDSVVTLHLSEFHPRGIFPPESSHELEYIRMPQIMAASFDLIVVDGRFRRRCMEVAAGCLKRQGKVFLHDAERDFYHSALGIFKCGQFIDGGKFYPFEPRQHKVWIGSMNE